MYFKRQNNSIPIDPLLSRSSMSRSILQAENDGPPATGSRGEVEQLFVMGIPLHKTSRLFQYLFAVAGIMLFFLLYGYVQVLLTHNSFVCECIILASINL